MALTATAQTTYVTKALTDDFEPSFDFNGTTNYVTLFVSEDEADALGESKILKNENPTDLDGARPLYIWSNTYNGGAGDGFNSFNGSGYMSFVVGTGGWSGLGHCGVVDAASEKDGYDLSMLKTGTWYLHMAFMDKGTVHATHNVCLYGRDKDNKEVGGHFALGAKQTDAAYTVIGDFPRDGEWYNVDIPLDDLKDLGFSAEGSDCSAINGNVLTFLSGGDTGAQLNYDAVFFYQKTSDVVNGISNVKTFKDNGVKAVYDINGRQVTNTEKAGIYIVKTADGVKKIVKN